MFLLPVSDRGEEETLMYVFIEDTARVMTFAYRAHSGYRWGSSIEKNELVPCLQKNKKRLTFVKPPLTPPGDKKIPPKLCL